MTSRPGLYIAVGAILLGTWGISDRVIKLENNSSSYLSNMKQQQNITRAHISELNESIKKLNTKVSELELSIEELKEMYQTAESK